MHLKHETRGPAAMEIEYRRPGLLQTVRHSCSENAGSLDSIINEVLLKEFEDKPRRSFLETLRGFQSSLQLLGATLAREAQLLESMEAKAVEFKIELNSDSSNPDDPTPTMANVPQTTSQPQPSLFPGLSARYPAIGEDYEPAITYGPPLLRRIRTCCTDDAASQALTISEILQDVFAMARTPMKIEILSNFEENLRSVSATLVREVTILDSMERYAAMWRRILAKAGTAPEVEDEVLVNEAGDALEDECLPEPILPDHYSLESPPPTHENAPQPPMTPEEVLKLLQSLPLRAATLKGYDFRFTKGFMNGVLQLCALILGLDNKLFANEQAKCIVDACFKAAGQPYELVFIADGPGLLKMEFAKLPKHGPAPQHAAPVATPPTPVTPHINEEGPATVQHVDPRRLVTHPDLAHTTKGNVAATVSLPREEQPQQPAFEVDPKTLTPNAPENDYNGRPYISATHETAINQDRESIETSTSRYICVDAPETFNTPRMSISCNAQDSMTTPKEHKMTADGIPDTFEEPLSNVGKTSYNQWVEQTIDSIEQVSPNGDDAASDTARDDGKNGVVADILDTGETDAQSARPLITAERGSSTVLALEHVSDVRDTNTSVEPIPVIDNFHDLPTSLVRPSLDEREVDVLRRFAAEFDRLESPHESYLVAGTFDERRKRRQLAEEAFEILMSKISLVPTISEEAENYLLDKFTDHIFNHSLAADVLPQKFPRNRNTDKEIHSPVSIAEKSIKHSDRERMDSSTARHPTPLVDFTKEAVDISIYDATPPPQEASLSSKVFNSQIHAYNSTELDRSFQRRQRSLSALTTEALTLSSTVSEPENSFDKGKESDGQVVDGESGCIDEGPGAYPIKGIITREELFAAIERNWGASVGDVCTRPLWCRVPSRRIVLELLVRLSEVCTLTDANAQLRVEVRTRRNLNRNFRYVNESVLRSLVAANEPFRAERQDKDGGPSSSDSPRPMSRPLPQIGSTEDRSVSSDFSDTDGELKALEVDQDEHALAEQESVIEDGHRKHRYTSKEIALLIQLKKENKSWQEIVKAFKPFHRTLESLQFKLRSLKTRPSVRVRTVLNASEQTPPSESHRHDAAASTMGERGESENGHVRSGAANGSAAQVLGQTLRQQDMPASTEEILESGQRQPRDHDRRKRYTSDEIELLFRLKREKKSWLQIEERFKGTTHTLRSLQSKYATLKSDMNDAAGQVSEILQGPPLDEVSIGEHLNMIAEPCGAAATGAAMREKIDPKVVFEAESAPANTSPIAPAVPGVVLSSPESSLASTLSSRLPIAFSQIMGSPDYVDFKVKMDNHEDELREGHLYRVGGWGTEKLELENVQSPERLEAIADALWVSIVSHASSSLKDKWGAIEALDRAFTYYVVSHGGFGLLDVKKKVLNHKFGRTRKACTAGTHDTSEIVHQMLDANPRPEKRGCVEEAIRVAHIYIGHAETVVEVEVRAYDLFEAIIDGCRHNSKVKQSAISSLTVALAGCLDAAQNLALCQDDVINQLSEATGDEAAVIQELPESTDEARIPPPPTIEDEPRQSKVSMRTTSAPGEPELPTEVHVLEPMDSEGQPLDFQTGLDDNTIPVPIIIESSSNNPSGKSATNLQVFEAVSSEHAQQSPVASATPSPKARARDGIAGLDAPLTHAPSTRSIVCMDEYDNDRQPNLPRSPDVLHKPKQSSPAINPSKKSKVDTLRPQTTIDKEDEVVEIPVEEYMTPGKPKSVSERIKRSKTMGSQSTPNLYGARHTTVVPSDATKTVTNCMSPKSVDEGDEAVELPVKTPSGWNKNPIRVADSANDGSSKHAKMSLAPAPPAAIESVDAASMHAASRPPNSAEPPAAQPPVTSLQSQEMPAMDAPLFRKDEVNQVVNAILPHRTSKARGSGFDLVTKLSEGRDAITSAKAQAMEKKLYKGLKEYGGQDDITSSGYVGLGKGVQEHIQNKPLNNRCPDHNVAEYQFTTSNISGQTSPERPSTRPATPNLPMETSSSSATRMRLTPESLNSSARERLKADAHCTAADMLVANADPYSRAANLAQVNIAVKFLEARGPDSMAALEDAKLELFKCIDVARKGLYTKEAKYCAEDSVQEAIAIFAGQNNVEQGTVVANSQSSESRKAAAGQASSATSVRDGNISEIVPRERPLEPMEDGSACLNRAPGVLLRSRLFSDRLSDKVQANLADIAGIWKQSPPQSHTLTQNAANAKDRTPDTQPPSDATNQAKTQPAASVTLTPLPARPPVVWNGSKFAVTESTKDILPSGVSDTPRQTLLATSGGEQPSPIVHERVNPDSSAPVLATSGAMLGSSNSSIVDDQDRRRAIESLEKAFVWSLNELKEIGDFDGQNLEQTARTLALGLEQAIHNLSIGKYVYLRQVRTYFNAMDGYSGWTKRILDDPEYVEALVQMAAEKLSNETRLMRTQYSRTAEELVAKPQAAVEEATAQTSAESRALPPLLTCRQGQDMSASQCSHAQLRCSEVGCTSTRSSRPATGSESSGQDNLIQLPSPPEGRSDSRKRASSTVLNNPSSKRVVKAVDVERDEDAAFQEKPGAPKYILSKWMRTGGILNPAKPKRKRATQTPTGTIQKRSTKAADQPPPSVQTLSAESTGAGPVETEGAALAETSKTVTQTSGPNPGRQHESSKRSQRDRPSSRATHSATQPHNSGPEPRASAPLAATLQQEAQTPASLTDEAPSAVLTVDQYHSHYIPQPTVLAPDEYHNHYIRPPIPSQSTATLSSAASFFNQHAVHQRANTAVKQSIHDLKPLPEPSMEEMPTAYDDIYEEFPPGLNIEPPSRDSSPASLQPGFADRIYPPEGWIDPSGFAYPQRSPPPAHRETFGFVTPVMRFMQRRGTSDEEERDLSRMIDENGQIKEEAFVVEDD